MRERILRLLRESLNEIADDIIARSTNYVPVDTGFLRDSVKKSITIGHVLNLLLRFVNSAVF
jgi:hypothetical protein